MSFITFLNDILRQNKIDEKVFGPYIIGILQGADETLEEKREALREFISELIVKLYLFKAYYDKLFTHFRKKILKNL